ncbi:hypothetical protein ACOMHN_023419 [Nucella lapillus]
MNLRCPLARAQGCTQLQQEYRPQMNLRCPLARPQGCTQLQQEYRPQMNLRCPLARPQGCTQLQQEYRPQMNLRCPLARAQGCTQLQQEYRLCWPPTLRCHLESPDGSHPRPHEDVVVSLSRLPAAAGPLCPQPGREL